MYYYRPPDSGDTSCPASLSSAAIDSGCRSVRDEMIIFPLALLKINNCAYQAYHWCKFGLANNESIALKSQSYDPRLRPWYTNAKAVGKPCYSALFTFAVSVGTIPGVAFTVPWYAAGTATLIGVATTDFDSTLFQAVLNPFKTATNTVYLVERSTFYLIAASNGANSVTNGALTQVCANLNPAIQATGCYLTQSSSAWRLDGDYSIVSGGVTYATNLQSYTDTTTTLAWKIIVVNSRTSVPATNYVQTIDECLAASVDEVERTWDIVSSISSTTAFHHNGNEYTPLSNPPQSVTNTPSTGSTQQTFWTMDRNYNMYTGILVVSVLRKSVRLSMYVMGRSFVHLERYLRRV